MGPAWAGHRAGEWLAALDFLCKGFCLKRVGRGSDAPQLAGVVGPSRCAGTEERRQPLLRTLRMQAPNTTGCQLVDVLRHTRRKRKLPMPEVLAAAHGLIAAAARGAALGAAAADSSGPPSCIHVKWGNPSKSLLPDFRK